MTETVFRSCTLCEAHCGLRFEVEGGTITAVRPDPDDVLSRGFVCPKGVAIADVHRDPDRLRTPVRRRPDGALERIAWDEALDLVGTRLGALRARHGADAIAVYLGNPIVHDGAAMLAAPGFIKAIGTRNRTSASAQDTSPRFAASYFLYGSSFVVPVPDVDRTDYFLCVGANPHVSNGSFLTAPNMRARLRAIQRRGGKVVVVDPRRTETAAAADEHVSIRPGADAALLLGMVQVLLERGRVDGAAIAAVADGLEAVVRRLAPFTLDRVARQSGVPAATIERLALEFADAPTAAAYSRIGVCNNAFGTLATWATDLLNLAAGRLGAVGGAMFTTPPLDLAGVLHQSGTDGYDRWRTRVRGLPETAGDVPASTLAEEIETPGPGRIRGLITFAGNPVLSTPNGRRLEAALGTLDFMVSVDIYQNETTRHADVILPPAWILADEHLDALFPLFTARNVARWGPPVVRPGPDERADWEILCAIAERLGGGLTGYPLVDRGIRWARRLGLRVTPHTLADLLLRLGPYGDRFLPGGRGLSLRKLRNAPHGIDLGPLEPGVRRRVFHPDGRVRLDTPVMLGALDALAAALDTAPREELLLIGRRELRSNNSWMHNVPALVAGRERCVLLVHPDDAARAGVRDGERAVLESRVHRAEVPVKLSTDMRPGVVSLPHGWGHARAGAGLRVAGGRPGVSANDWTDDQLVESVVGQSILNGVTVRLERAAARARPPDAIAS